MVSQGIARKEKSEIPSLQVIRTPDRSGSEEGSSS